MKYLLSIAAALCITGIASAQSRRLQETWETGYNKGDATGAHVLGYWKFDGDDVLKDSSGKGNVLVLHGAVTVAEGRFGGAMASFPGFPVQDKDHSAQTEPRPKLSPKGAFTMERWIKAKPEFASKLRAHLLDKKYVDHTDYQWTLGDADKAGLRRMAVNLGFGAESKLYHSELMKLEAGVWHHVAFIYDGAGEGRFFMDGQALGVMRHPGYGAIMPGTKPLSIGDRRGSSYGGFPGFIDEVRICEGVLSFEQVAMRIASNRRVWRRMERAKPVEVVVTNLRRTPLSGAKLHLSVGSEEVVVDIQKLAPGEDFTAKYSLDTALKADRYTLRTRLEITEPKPYATVQSAEFQIMPRPAPNTMPVIMWGAGNDEMTRLKDITDMKQAAVKAVVPVQLEVRDANGKPAEGSGYYGAKDGTLSVKLDIAGNDDPGVWTVRVRELASRMEAVRYVRVVK